MSISYIEKYYTTGIFRNNQSCTITRESPLHHNVFPSQLPTVGHLAIPQSGRQRSSLIPIYPDRSCPMYIIRIHNVKI